MECGVLAEKGQCGSPCGGAAWLVGRAFQTIIKAVGDKIPTHGFLPKGNRLVWRGCFVLCGLGPFFFFFLLARKSCNVLEGKWHLRFNLTPSRVGY